MLYSFSLTLFAGISTLLGTFLIFMDIKNINKTICASLSFSSSVMLFISILDLFPESFSLLHLKYNSIVSLLFFIIIMLIGLFIAKIINNLFDEKSSLYKVGIISMISIILHNIPEGILTFMTSSINRKIGLNLAIAIAMHNIPEGMSISIPIYYSTKSRLKAFLYTLISALSEPLGAIISYLFLSNFINNSFIAILLSFVCGIMIYISLFELLKEAFKYNYSNIMKIFFLIGFIFVFINIILNK